MRTARVERRRLGTVVLMLIMTTAGACTAEPPREPTPSPTGSSRAPADMFPALEGRTATGARVFTSALASLNDRVVSVGLYWDGVASASFGWSDDGGRTWQAGRAPTPERPAREQADHVAVRVHGGKTTWLAVGSSNDSFARWTSADGVGWAPAVIDGSVLDDTADRIRDLKSTDQGFAASGSFTDDRGKDHPRIWTTPDGDGWKVHKLPGSGTVSGLATRGREWVAVGSSGDDWRVWRSVDAGAHWSRVDKIRRAGGDSDFNRFFDDVVRHGDGFVAIGGYHSDDLGGGRSSYQPMVYRSADGKTWRHDRRSAALGRAGDSSGQTLASQGGELTAVVNLNRTMDREEI